MLRGIRIFYDFQKNYICPTVVLCKCRRPVDFRDNVWRNSHSPTRHCAFTNRWQWLLQCDMSKSTPVGHGVSIRLTFLIQLYNRPQPCDPWKFRTKGCDHEIVYAGQKLKYMQKSMVGQAHKERAMLQMTRKIHHRLFFRLAKLCSNPQMTLQQQPSDLTNSVQDGHFIYPNLILAYHLLGVHVGSRVWLATVSVAYSLIKWMYHYWKANVATQIQSMDGISHVRGSWSSALKTNHVQNRYKNV